MTDTEARKARYAAALSSANLDAILRVVDDETAEQRARAEAAEAKLAAVRDLAARWRQESSVRGPEDKVFSSGVANMLFAAVGEADAPTVGREQETVVWADKRLVVPSRPGICVHNVGTTRGFWCSECMALEAGRATDAPTVGREPCSGCGGTGLVDWYPGQQRNSDEEQQPCPDCTNTRPTVGRDETGADR